MKENKFHKWQNEIKKKVLASLGLSVPDFWQKFDSIEQRDNKYFFVISLLNSVQLAYALGQISFNDLMLFEKREHRLHFDAIKNDSLQRASLNQVSLVDSLLSQEELIYKLGLNKIDLDRLFPTFSEVLSDVLKEERYFDTYIDLAAQIPPQIMQEMIIFRKAVRLYIDSQYHLFQMPLDLNNKLRVIQTMDQKNPSLTHLNQIDLLQGIIFSLSSEQQHIEADEILRLRISGIILSQTAFLNSLKRLIKMYSEIPDSRAFKQRGLKQLEDLYRISPLQIMSSQEEKEYMQNFISNVRNILVFGIHDPYLRQRRLKWFDTSMNYTPTEREQKKLVFSQKRNLIREVVYEPETDFTAIDDQGQIISVEKSKSGTAGFSHNGEYDFSIVYNVLMGLSSEKSLFSSQIILDFNNLKENVELRDNPKHYLKDDDLSSKVVYPKFVNLRDAFWKEIIREKMGKNTSASEEAKKIASFNLLSDSDLLYIIGFLSKNQRDIFQKINNKIVETRIKKQQMEEEESGAFCVELPSWNDLQKVFKDNGYPEKIPMSVELNGFLRDVKLLSFLYFFHYISPEQYQLDFSEKNFQKDYLSFHFSDLDLVILAKCIGLINGLEKPSSTMEKVSEALCQRIYQKRLEEIDDLPLKSFSLDTRYRMKVMKNYLRDLAGQPKITTDEQEKAAWSHLFHALRGEILKQPLPRKEQNKLLNMFNEYVEPLDEYRTKIRSPHKLFRKNILKSGKFERGKFKN